VVGELNMMQGLVTLPSQGTFYSFVECSETIAQLGYEDDLSLVEGILTSTGVALVPGSAFGLPNHFRLSYATNMSVLEQACERLRSFFNR
jgi:aspartate aminotransferase